MIAGRCAKGSLCALLLSALLLSVCGCSGSWPSSPTPIKALLDRPRDYEGKIVTISGEVTEVFSLIVVKTFSLRDKTGEIVVVTERISPKKGDHIAVKGTVIDAFSFGDKSITAFKESQE